MKYLLYSLLLLLGLSHQSQAQVTITGPSYAQYWGGYSNTSPVGVTFLVTNNNPNPILLTDVGVLCYYLLKHELWYSSTSLSGTTGAINASNPAWTKISTVNPTATSGSIVNNFYSNLNLVIPAGTTYRFAHTVDQVTGIVGVMYFGSSNPVGPFTPGAITSNGVTLDANNAMWGATNSGLSIANYGFYGSITFSPCAYMASGLGANNIKSTSANVYWNPILTGSIGFDYIVTTSATAPTSGFSSTTATATNFSITGLTPATLYRLFVRNKCSSTSFSGWVEYQFTTAPLCSKPTVTITDIKETSAKIAWKTATHAANYEYVLDQSTSDPGSPGKLSTGTENETGLTEGTTYYVHVKMNCNSGENSGWTLDSFTTSFVCRPPALTVDYQHVDRALIYWQPKKGAYEYEYELSQSPTPLGNGTAIKNTSFLAFPLKDGQVYYFHVRSKCEDRGYKSKSDWGTTSFKTFPTSVNNLSGNDPGITVYPNPVKNTLTVKTGSAENGGTITITDINGRMIYSGVFEGKTQEIDMANFANGVYLLKYISADGGSQIIRVMKQ